MPFLFHGVLFQIARECCAIMEEALNSPTGTVFAAVQPDILDCSVKLVSSFFLTTYIFLFEKALNSPTGTVFADAQSDTLDCFVK